MGTKEGFHRTRRNGMNGLNSLNECDICIVVPQVVSDYLPITTVTMAKTVERNNLQINRHYTQ